MTRLFTAVLPEDLLSLLGWKNMATYADAFDYFAGKGMLISIDKYEESYFYTIYTHRHLTDDQFSSWEDAANQAIRSCFNLLNFM